VEVAEVGFVKTEDHPLRAATPVGVAAIAFHHRRIPKSLLQTHQKSYRAGEGAAVESAVPKCPAHKQKNYKEAKLQA